MTLDSAYLTNGLSLLKAIAVKLALLSLSLYTRLAKALSAFGLKLTSAVALYCFFCIALLFKVIMFVTFVQHITVRTQLNDA